MVLNEARKNKRNYIRMDVRAQVTCVNEKTGEKITGSCLNLSHTGVKFETTELIKKGTKLQITVNVDGDKISPLKADLIVTRVEKSKKTNKYYISGQLRNVR